MFFAKAGLVIDPNLESADMAPMAWGDVDGDGDADLLVDTTWCSADCAHRLDLVLNNDGRPILFTGSDQNVFEPWYIPDGPYRSQRLSAQIDGSTITLTGVLLCGEVELSPDDPDSPCSEDLVRTATYRFQDGALTPISAEPPIG